MNPIVKSIFAWLSETVLASVMELSLLSLINIWNCIVVHFDICLPRIDIVKLCKVANYKDASTSYEPFQTPTTDDLIVLDFDSISAESENWTKSTVTATEAEENDCFGFTEFKREGKGKKQLKLSLENGENKGFKESKKLTEDFKFPDGSYYDEMKKFVVEEITQGNNESHFQKAPFVNLYSNNVGNGLITEGLCDSLGCTLPSKYSKFRNIPLQFADYSENFQKTYDFQETTNELFNAEVHCVQNYLMNGAVIRKNVETTVAKMKSNTNKEERLSIEEISLADWSQTLKYPSKMKSDNKKHIKTQHILNSLAISPVKGFEAKIPETAAENNEMNNSEDLSIKEFLSSEKVSLNDWQENQTEKQKSIGKNVFHSQSNISLVAYKNDGNSCKQNPVRNSNIVNQKYNRISDFCNQEYTSAIVDETGCADENMLFSSVTDNISEIHIQPSHIKNSIRTRYEIKDTSLIHDSEAKEKTSRDWYLESMRAKHKILGSAVMYNKLHNSVDRNLNFKARETPESHFKQHDLSKHNGQSENQKIVNDLNLRNKFESRMVVENDNEILRENEDGNEPKEGENILGCDSYLENRSGEYLCAFPAPLSPLTENYDEENLGETHLKTTTTSVLQGEQVVENQTDGTVFCTSTLVTPTNIQTEPIQGSKKVKFKPEVQTFTYETEHSMMESFVDAVDFGIENPFPLRRRSPLSRNFTIRNCYDSINSEDNYREDWVNYDQRLINIMRDHPRIPEEISQDYMEDITDVPEKQLKFWPRLKKDRKIFRRMKVPYVKSDGEVNSISHHLQSLKLDPKPLFDKLRKKVFGK